MAHINAFSIFNCIAGINTIFVSHNKYLKMSSILILKHLYVFILYKMVIAFPRGVCEDIFY